MLCICNICLVATLGILVITEPLNAISVFQEVIDFVDQQYKTDSVQSSLSKIRKGAAELKNVSCMTVFRNSQYNI